MNKLCTASRIAITAVLGVSVVLVSACSGRVAPTTSPTCVRTVSASDVTENEGVDAGVTGYTEFTFTISSTGCAAAGTIQYTVEPVGDHETADGDFTGATQGQATFGSEAGMPTITIPIRVVDDDADEPIETFAVCITPVNLDGTIQPAVVEGIGIILDDDGLPLPLGLTLMPKPDELHCSR